MKHIAFALLVTLALVTGCATTKPRPEPAAKADKAVAAREEIQPVNSWADYREQLRSSGESETMP